MSRRFSFGLKKENILPQNILSFPKNIMVPSWYNSNVNVFRFFVSPNGDDKNDGLSWSNAKREIDSALGELPEEGRNSEAWIIIEGGSYGPLTNLSRLKNISIKIVAASTNWVNNGTGNQAVFMRAGAVNPVSNDNQIIISGTVNDRIITPGSLTSGLSCEFSTLNNDDLKRQFGRFVFKPGTHGNDPVIFLEGAYYTFDFCVFDVTGWNSTNPFVWSNGNSMTLLGGQIIGDPNYSHSNSTSAWRGIFVLRHNDDDKCNYWGAVVSASSDFESGFAPPNGKLFDISEVANLFTDFYAGGENKHNTNVKIAIKSDCYYTAPTLGRTTFNIALTSGWRGTIEYDPSLTTIADGSTDPHTIIDSVSGNTKKLLTATTSENLNNFRIKLLTSIPADGTLDNNDLIISVDETGNTLNFKLKYSSGTVKSGTISLI